MAVRVDGVAARERLQRLVGAGHAGTPHDRLHGLGEHLPGGVEVVADRPLVHAELAEALQNRGDRDLQVTRTDTEVPERGRVGQVALPARHGQLRREVAEHGAGEPEVALGVLEVDRVDLVRHRRRADLAGDGALRQVAERDVAPDVAAQVDQDGVEAGGRVEQLGDAVVRLDLRRVRVVDEPEGGDEARGHVRPVDVGVGDDVGVEVADRAVDLAEELGLGERASLAAHAVHDVRELLAERGRARGLAVRAREEGDVGRVAGERREGRVQRVDAGEQVLVPPAREQPVPGEVVDVLGRAGEVHELAVRGEAGERGVGLEALLDEVLDRLDVVVRRALDRLDARGVGDREPLADREQGVPLGGGRARELGHAGLVAEVQEPQDLDAHALADQRELAEQASQGHGAGGVATVDRRDRRQLVERERLVVGARDERVGGAGGGSGGGHGRRHRGVGRCPSACGPARRRSPGKGDRPRPCRGRTKTSGRRASRTGRARAKRTIDGSGGKMVGAIGFEPTTPTMSR